MPSEKLGRSSTKKEMDLSAKVISAINTSSELSGLEKMIRKVVSEELKKAMFIPSEPAARSSDTEESENEILDFLETF